jgi:hypothetical protein
MYFRYAKLQPCLAQFREEMNLHEFLIDVEHLLEGSRTGR